MRHCPLHHDGEGTQRNLWATLHEHDEPHDGADGKMVAAAKTTAWGVKHGSLALILDGENYRRLTRYQLATTDRIDPPKATATSGTIYFTPTPFNIMTIQEAQKKRQKVYEIQEAVTDIGVERIVASVA